MSSTSDPGEPSADRQWRTRLAGAAARRARAEAAFYATVAEIGAHVSQSEMAAVLHTRQSTVSRWVTRGREQAAQVPPGQLARTAYEVAQRYAAGEITREQMLDALIRWPYEPEQPLALEEWQITPVQAGSGSFEETTASAYDDGLITAEDYDTILGALADPAPEQPGGGQVPPQQR